MHPLQARAKDMVVESWEDGRVETEAWLQGQNVRQVADAPVVGSVRTTIKLSHGSYRLPFSNDLLMDRFDAEYGACGLLWRILWLWFLYKCVIVFSFLVWCCITYCMKVWYRLHAWQIEYWMLLGVMQMCVCAFGLYEGILASYMYIV